VAEQVEVAAEAAKLAARPEAAVLVEADSVAEEVKVLAVVVQVDPEVVLAAVAAATMAPEAIMVLAEVAAATTVLVATMARVEDEEGITAAPGEVDSGDLAVEVSVVVDRVVNLPRLVPGLPRTLRPSGSMQPSPVSSRLTEF